MQDTHLFPRSTLPGDPTINNGRPTVVVNTQATVLFTRTQHLSALDILPDQSAWSPTATLNPGPIIVMFYGADTFFTFPLPGNVFINKIIARITSDGYQIKGFDGYAGVGPAFDWLLSQLDTNGNGVYDPAARTNPDVSRNIEIAGHSWGGISVSFLCNKIRNSNQFKDNKVYLAFAIDPISIARSGDGRIRNNVHIYIDDYQTNPNANDGIPIVLQRINGIRVDSDADINYYDDIYTDVNAEQDTNVMHLSILIDVAFQLINTLEDYSLYEHAGGS